MNNLLRLLALSTVVLLGALGCNTTGLVGGECLRGLSPCGGTCVNLGTNEGNCGGCGRTCDDGEACLAGVCIVSDDTDQTAPNPTNGTDDTSAGSNGPDASATDSTSEIRDGGGVSRDASADASDSSTEPVEAGPEPCFPPYNSAENCGACDVICTEEAPFCAPSGDTFACVDGCNEPLQLCADRCVNLVTDPLHCGECGNDCPTGLCRNSECVGGQIGHLIAMCFSYEQLFGNSPQGVLLANAVFLATKKTTRVMMFDAYAPDAAKNQARSLILNQATARTRPVRINTASTVPEIVAGLKVANYEVLVIADTSLAPPGTARDMGRALSTTIDTFARAGGIVIVTSGSAATEMPQFWGDDGANIFSMRGVIDATFMELQNRAPADALAANVLTPFLALTSSCLFDMDSAFDADTEVVITGTNPGDAGGELPVVLHRVMYP